MKQIALGIKQYLQDYDETLPRYYYGGATPYYMHNAIDPYVKSSQILICPSAPKPASTVIDYFYNLNLGTDTKSFKESEVEYSANVIMLGDSNPMDIQNYANCPVENGTGCQVNTGGRYGIGVCGATKILVGSDQDPTGSKARNRHLEGLNLAFVDGHEKWMKDSKIAYTAPDGSNATFNRDANPS